VSGPDDPYLTILVISRVVTELGSLRQVTPREVEGLFAADLAFLQDLYGIINFGDPADVEALQRAAVPEATASEAAGVEGNGGAEAVTASSLEADASRVSRARGQIEEVKIPAER
jgi:hypothetical protein